MSEEESFVILGSSPTESMDNYSIIQKLSSKNDSDKLKSNVQQSSGSNPSPGCSSKSAMDSLTSKEYMTLSRDEKKTETDGFSSPQPVIGDNGSELIAEKQQGVSFQLSGSVSANPTPSLLDMRNKSLASSFLLGEIDGDELRGNILAEFPSLCGPTATPDELLKLQKFMGEYMALKNNAVKSNSSMRQYFTIMQKWQTDIKTYRDQQENQIKDCKEQVAKLRNENMALQQELNTKIEQIHITEKAMRKENEDLVKLVSEKSSIIENMRAQIEKLECHQHFSFEYVKRINDDGDDIDHEYIRVSDHRTIVKELENKLSEAIAGKIDLQNMESMYVDEINCLKVNLTAAEELLKKNQADICVLKSKDCEKSELFEKYEKEKDEMRQEMNLLRTQLEVYSKDFEMERTVRENLDKEKEQLLTDLKMLQRRNQMLIEDAEARSKQDRGENHTTAVSSSTTSARKVFLRNRNETPSTVTPQDDQTRNSSNYVCPLCNSNFKCLNALQNHVQDCLDKA